MDWIRRRRVKDLLYEQVATISKAVASPKRLELIELLCQSREDRGDAGRAGPDQRQARQRPPADSSRARDWWRAAETASTCYYRLIDHTVADFWVACGSSPRSVCSSCSRGLRDLAGARTLSSSRSIAAPSSSRRGAARSSFSTCGPRRSSRPSHLPFARSMPLAELRRRLKELPKDKPVVAYCRGPFCLMAGEAVELLRKKGFRAQRLEDGVAEWRSRGLPVETDGERRR